MSARQAAPAPEPTVGSCAGLQPGDGTGGRSELVRHRSLRIRRHTSASTGNSFYGGQQFTEQTRLGYGGAGYAPSANLASPGAAANTAQVSPARTGIALAPTDR